MTGVKPYPKGRKTTWEEIEAGQAREELTSGGLTKAQAIEAGRALQSRMHGTGWFLSVWQNCGWHYRVHRGALQVYVSHYGRTLRYHTLLAAEAPGPDHMKPIGGAQIFSTSMIHTDPNKAVRVQVKYARWVVAQLTKAIDSGEGITR